MMYPINPETNIIKLDIKYLNDSFLSFFLIKSNRYKSIAAPNKGA